MKLRWIPMLLLLLLLSAVPARAAGALHTAYLAGYPDGTIRPEAPVTRAQLAQILNALLGRTPASLDALQLGMPIFDDNRDARAWYFLPIQEAAVTHTAAQSGAWERWDALG